MAKPGKKESLNGKLIADNRKARHNYEFVDSIEAGIQLTGTEVKSLRNGQANIGESYATEENGELWLINAYIPELTEGNRFNHNPRRKRKLLVHRKQMANLFQSVSRDGMTLVPNRLYFNERGLAKLQLALAKGRKAHDKREVKKERDWKREQARLLREKG